VRGGAKLAPDLAECVRCMRAAAALDDMSALYWLATTALAELDEEHAGAGREQGGPRAFVGMGLDECLAALTRAGDLGKCGGGGEGCEVYAFKNDLERC